MLREFTKNLRLLFAGFAFLSLTGGGIRQFQWIYPSIITIALCAAIIEWDDYSFEFFPDRNLGQITNTIGIISGFFIAALAAVSTFQSPNLDQPVSGYGVVESVTKNGNRIQISATRRRLLTKLFGYCTTIAIIALVWPLTSNLLTENIDDLFDRDFARITARILEAIYLWFSASLLVSTLLGIHYLVDRIHR